MNKTLRSIALFAFAVLSNTLAFAEDFNIENACVKDFMDNVSYSFDDDSKVEEIFVKSAYNKMVRKDYQNIAYPTTWTNRSQIMEYNMVPGKQYKYGYERNEVTFYSSFSAVGRVRFIDTDGTRNVRDLGGWTTIDGKKTKYEKIYRGAAIAEMDFDLVKGIGVKAELDLRNDEEITKAPRIVDNNVDYLRVDIGIDEVKNENGVNIFQHKRVAIDKRAKFAQCFKFILDELRQDKPVYFHCKIGCDRAGTLALLLEGALGFSYSDLIKEYELSTMSQNIRTKDRIDPFLDYIMSLEGNNLKEKFYTYWTTGTTITKEELDEFCGYILTNTTDGSHTHDYCTKNQINVANSGTYSYQCTTCGRCEVPNFSITDKQPLNVNVEFTAGNVEYNRTFSTSWATICLPYDAVVPTGYECYWLESLDFDSPIPTINFKPVALTKGQYILKAYSAYIIRYSPTATGTPTASDFNATDVLFKLPENAEEKNGIMEGVIAEKLIFTQEYLDANAQYKFFGLASNGEFVALGKDSSCPPFRAYFKIDRSLLHTTAKIRVSYEEYNYEEFTIIDNVEASNAVDGNAYNLNGQIVDANTYKGIVIRNNKKTINR